MNIHTCDEYIKTVIEEQDKDPESPYVCNLEYKSC